MQNDKKQVQIAVIVITLGFSFILFAITYAILKYDSPRAELQQAEWKSINITNTGWKSIPQEEDIENWKSVENTQIANTEKIELSNMVKNDEPQKCQGECRSVFNVFATCEDEVGECESWEKCCKDDQQSVDLFVNPIEDPVLGKPTLTSQDITLLDEIDNIKNFGLTCFDYDDRLKVHDGSLKAEIVSHLESQNIDLNTFDINECQELGGFIDCNPGEYDSQLLYDAWFYDPSKCPGTPEFIASGNPEPEDLDLVPGCAMLRANSPQLKEGQSGGVELTLKRGYQLMDPITVDYTITGQTPFDIYGDNLSGQQTIDKDSCSEELYITYNLNNSSIEEGNYLIDIYATMDDKTNTIERQDITGVFYKKNPPPQEPGDFDGLVIEAMEVEKMPVPGEEGIFSLYYKDEGNTPLEGDNTGIKMEVTNMGAFEGMTSPFGETLDISVVNSRISSYSRDRYSDIVQAAANPSEKRLDFKWTPKYCGDYVLRFFDNNDNLIEETEGFPNKNGLRGSIPCKDIGRSERELVGSAKRDNIGMVKGCVQVEDSLYCGFENDQTAPLYKINAEPHEEAIQMMKVGDFNSDPYNQLGYPNECIYRTSDQKVYCFHGDYIPSDNMPVVSPNISKFDPENPNNIEFHHSIELGVVHIQSCVYAENADSTYCYVYLLTNTGSVEPKTLVHNFNNDSQYLLDLEGKHPLLEGFKNMGENMVYYDGKIFFRAQTNYQHSIIIELNPEDNSVYITGVDDRRIFSNPGAVIEGSRIYSPFMDMDLEQGVASTPDAEYDERWNGHNAFVKDGKVITIYSGYVIVMGKRVQRTITRWIDVAPDQAPCEGKDNGMSCIKDIYWENPATNFIPHPEGVTQGLCSAQECVRPDWNHKGLKYIGEYCSEDANCASERCNTEKNICESFNGPRLIIKSSHDSYLLDEINKSQVADNRSGHLLYDGAGIRKYFDTGMHSWLDSISLDINNHGNEELEITDVYLDNNNILLSLGINNRNKLPGLIPTTGFPTKDPIGITGYIPTGISVDFLKCTEYRDTSTGAYSEALGCRLLGNSRDKGCFVDTKLTIETNENGVANGDNKFDIVIQVSCPEYPKGRICESHLDCGYPNNDMFCGDHTTGASKYCYEMNTNTMACQPYGCCLENNDCEDISIPFCVQNFKARGVAGRCYKGTQEEYCDLNQGNNDCAEGFSCINDNNGDNIGKCDEDNPAPAGCNSHEECGYPNSQQICIDLDGDNIKKCEDLNGNCLANSDCTDSSRPFCVSSLIPMDGGDITAGYCGSGNIEPDNYCDIMNGVQPGQGDCQEGYFCDVSFFPDRSDLARCSPVGGNPSPPLPEPYCGDNIVNQSSEHCDGPDHNGKTCQDLGFTGGTLSCYSSGSNKCKFNTSKCTSGNNNNPPISVNMNAPEERGFWSTLFGSLFNW